MYILVLYHIRCRIWWCQHVPYARALPGSPRPAARAVCCKCVERNTMSASWLSSSATEDTLGTDSLFCTLHARLCQSHSEYNGQVGRWAGGQVGKWSDMGLGGERVIGGKNCWSAGVLLRVLLDKSAAGPLLGLLSSTTAGPKSLTHSPCPTFYSSHIPGCIPVTSRSHPWIQLGLEPLHPSIFPTFRVMV